MSETHRIGEALERAERTVTLRPERGQRVYRNCASVRAGTRCEVAEGEQRLTIDVGRALGGEAAGPTPSTLLRAALTSCLAIGVKQWAARRGVPVEAVEVTVETDVDARGQLGVSPGITPGFEGIRLEIEVRSPAPRALVEEIVATSLKYSPLIEVFAKPQEIAQQVRITEPEAT